MIERLTHKRKTIAVSLALGLGGMAAAGCASDKWHVGGPGTTEQFTVDTQPIGEVIAQQERSFVATDARCDQFGRDMGFLVKNACTTYLLNTQVAVTDKVTKDGNRYTNIKVNESDTLFVSYCSTPNGVVGSDKSHLNIDRAPFQLESNVGGQTFRVPSPIGAIPSVESLRLEPLFEGIIQKDMPVDPCPTAGKIIPGNIQYQTY
jgi:hypothetical protein